MILRWEVGHGRGSAGSLFLTCGYTEAGEMQTFLRKMNPALEFKQYLPNKTKKKKGMEKVVSSQICGLTGSNLLHKTYEILRRHREEISECVAILIEDDLDNRFYGWSDEQINAYLEGVQKSVRNAVNCEIPVFILYAAPEIESWFIADWDHGFGYLYGYSDVDFGIKKARRYFAEQLKAFIKSEILKDYHDDIENYGMDGGKYVKLSDELQEGIRHGVKAYIAKLPHTNSAYVEQIMRSRAIAYSKKEHGGVMLRELVPERIEQKAYMRHFRRVYYEIHDFMVERDKD